MDIDIILAEDVTPSQFAELAVEAEKLGIRAVWSSNYHQNWDAFPDACARGNVDLPNILLGPLAVSPWEMHPAEDHQLTVDAERDVERSRDGCDQRRRRRVGCLRLEDC